MRISRRRNVLKITCSVPLNFVLSIVAPPLWIPSLGGDQVTLITDLDMEVPTIDETLLGTVRGISLAGDVVATAPYPSEFIAAILTIYGVPMVRLLMVY